MKTLCFLVCAFFGLAGIETAEAIDVPLWGRFETVIDYRSETGTSHSYSDPFYGVDLTATFLSPTGREVQWFGFFDGNGQGGQTGNIWKIRFMPDQLGTWTYTWSFSDGSASGWGWLKAVDTPLVPRKPGPLRHDADIGQWMITADGSHHVFTNMYNTDDGDVEGEHNPYLYPEEAIEAVVQSGCKILANHHTHWYEAPEEEDDPAIYLSTSSFKPRLQGWQMLERIYDIAYDHQIWVYEWDGFYSGNGLLDLHDNSTSLQNDVIRYILARSAPYYNLLFNVGFELCEYVDVPTWPVQRADFVESVDPWDHVIAAHQCNQDWYDYPEDPEIGMSALQAQDQFHERALDIWNSPSQPNPHLSEGIWNAIWQEQGTEDSHRNDMWESITGGMSFYFWPMDNYIGQDAFENANRFLNSGVPWWQTTPRDDLVVAGGALLLADPGQLYIAYDLTGTYCTLTVQAGSYRYRWFDPEDGDYTNWQNRTVPSTGSQNFSKPSSGEWVLDLQRSNLTTDGPDVVAAEPMRLEPVTPNPFADETAVRFSNARSLPVRVDVYAIDGRQVRVLADGLLEAGMHTLVWDARDDQGRAVPSGTYFVRMMSADGELVRPMLVVR